ncbi:iron-containing alcohol dehydrogenase [Amycolatopsis suaedae]
MGKASAVVQWECRTRVHAGEDAWNLAASGGILRPRSVLVLGAGFAAANFGLVEDIRRTLDVPSELVHLVKAPATVDQVESLAAVLARGSAENVVAIGGSSVLDVTKLACHQFADERTLPIVRARGARRGVIALPFEAPERVRQVLVPTTIGPAAEIRPYAAVRLRGHQRLVYGPALPPPHAIIDSGFTESLARQSILDGLLLSLTRFVEPHVEGGDRGVLMTAAVRAAASILASLGFRAKDAELSASDRLLACYLNAAQSGLVFAGRHPYVSMTWVIAAELMGVLDVRPVTALAAVVPSLWRRIEDGDRRFGDRERLREAWERIRAAGSVDLPEDPAAGISVLMRSWGIESDVVCTERAAVLAASRAARFWGGNLSAVAGVPVADLTRLIADSVTLSDQIRTAGASEPDRPLS